MAETPFRRGSVTQTGVQATRVSDPNLTAASFSREGVVDKSGLFEGQAEAAGLSGIAKGIQDFGQIALDIDEGFAKAQLEKQIEEEIALFKKSREPGFEEEQRDAHREALIDSKVLDAKATALRSVEGEGAAIQQLVPEYAQLTRRLENAKRTGAISLPDFELRVKAATREAINKRPGLLNELSRHAENILNITGVREQAKLDDQLLQQEAQQEQAMLDAIEKQLDRANLPFDRFNRNPVEEQRLLNQHRQQELAWKERGRLQEVQGLISEEQTNEFVRTEGLNLALGGFNELSSNLTQVFSDQGVNHSDALTIGTSMIQQYENDLIIAQSQANALNHPEAKVIRETTVTNAKALLDRLKATSSGEEALAVLENASKTIATNQKMGVMKTLNLTAIDAMNKVPEPLIKLLLSNPENRESFQRTILALANQATADPSLNFALEDSMITGKSNLSQMLGNNGFLSSMVPSNADRPEVAASKDATRYETMLESGLEFIDQKRATNPQQAFKVQSDLIAEYSNPKARSYLMNATGGTKTALNQLYENQAIVLTNNRNRLLDEASSQGIKINTRVLPDGRLVYQSDDASKKARDFVKRMNNTIGERYNDLIGAYSILFNMSVPETSNMLSEVFSSGSREDLLQAIDSRSQRLNRAEGEQDFMEGAKDLIINEEGFRSTTYKDIGGTPTIGYGFTSINGEPVKEGQRITREEADRELERQIKAHSSFKNRINIGLTPQQEQALASFEYNLGSGIWDKTGKPIIEAINRGDFEQAAEIIRSHNKAKVEGDLQEVQGLTRRREKEASLLVGES